MATPFPKLIVDPDSYPCELFCGDRVLPGVADLEPKSPSQVQLKGEIVERSRRGVRGFPEVDHFDELVGQLWSGHDLVLADCRCETWLPGRTLVAPRFALVGLNAAKVPGHAFEELTCQVGGLDLLFGRPPLKDFRWPRDSERFLEGEFTATGEPESTQEWVDEDATVTCSYWAQQSSIDNPYRFELSFAPVVTVKAAVSKQIDEWMRDFVMPLVRLVTLTTKTPQTVRWATVAQPTRDPDVQRPLPIRAQLFGSGIEQSPYASEDASAWRTAATRPIFNLAESGIALPSLLRSWRALDEGDNPFVELYRLAMFQRDLPQRAQFLYLVQSLEALHSYEHRAKDQADVEVYKTRRLETISRIEAAGPAADDLKFLKRAWSTRPRDDLAKRLRSLARHSGLPPIARITFESLDATSIYAGLGERNVENAVRRVRNDLAHGNRNYDERDLKRWTDVLDAVCRAHVLRLLGCPGSTIAAAFQLSDR